MEAEGKDAAELGWERVSILRCETALLCGPPDRVLFLAKGRLRGEPPTEFNWAQRGFPERCRRPQG
jgi:hypothetical protein